MQKHSVVPIPPHWHRARRCEGGPARARRLSISYCRVVHRPTRGKTSRRIASPISESDGRAAGRERGCRGTYSARHWRETAPLRTTQSVSAERRGAPASTVYATRQGQSTLHDLLVLSSDRVAGEQSWRDREEGGRPRLVPTRTHSTFYFHKAFCTGLWMGQTVQGVLVQFSSLVLAVRQPLPSPSAAHHLHRATLH